MATKTIRITQGEDVSVTIDLTDKNNVDANGVPAPFPLPAFTSCTAFFPAADPTLKSIAIPGTLVSADLGRLNFQLSDTQTMGLEVVDEGDIEVVVDQGATRTIAQILGKLQVAARLFQ